MRTKTKGILIRMLGILVLVSLMLAVPYKASRVNAQEETGSASVQPAEAPGDATVPSETSAVDSSQTSPPADSGTSEAGSVPDPSAVSSTPDSSLPVEDASDPSSSDSSLAEDDSLPTDEEEEEEEIGDGMLCRPGDIPDFVPAEIIKQGEMESPTLFVRRTARASFSSVSTSVVFNTIGVDDNATVQLSLTGPATTTVTLNGTGQLKVEGLPVGAYQARLVLSAGLQAQKVVVNGQTVANRKEFTIGVSSSGNMSVSITCAMADESLFASNNSARNQVSTGSWNKGYDIDISAVPNPVVPNPFDVVLLIDRSNSMEDSMLGAKLVGGASNQASRMYITKKSVDRFIRTLAKAPPPGSRLTIVSFAGGTEVVQEWCSLNDMASSSVTLDSVVRKVWDIYPPGGSKGGTMADLGFKQVRQQLEQAQNNQNDKYVVYFTDGSAGNHDLPANWNSPNTISTTNTQNFYRTMAKIYFENNFRVMAEARNQALFVKGPSGATVNANEIMWGYYDEADVHMAYYGLYGPQSRWEAYSNSTSLEQTNTEMVLTDFNQWNTIKAGNFSRTGTGLGAKIYSIGVFDDNTYRGESINFINRYMSAITTDPDKHYLSVKEEDELILAFELLSAQISSNYENTYVRYYVDEKKFAIKDRNQLEATPGVTIGTENGFTYVEWGPESIGVNNHFSRTIHLDPVDPGSTEKPDTRLLIGAQINNHYTIIGEDMITRSVTIK